MGAPTTAPSPVASPGGPVRVSRCRSRRRSVSAYARNPLHQAGQILRDRLRACRSDPCARDAVDEAARLLATRWMRFCPCSLARAGMVSVLTSGACQPLVRLLRADPGMMPSTPTATASAAKRARPYRGSGCSSSSELRHPVLRLPVPRTPARPRASCRCAGRTRTPWMLGPSATGQEKGNPSSIPRSAPPPPPGAPAPRSRRDSDRPR